MEPLTIETYQNDPLISLRMQEYARRERARIIGEYIALQFAQLRGRLDRLGERLGDRFARVRAPAPQLSHWG